MQIAYTFEAYIWRKCSKELFHWNALVESREEITGSGPGKCPWDLFGSQNGYCWVLYNWRLTKQFDIPKEIDILLNAGPFQTSHDYYSV